MTEEVTGSEGNAQRKCAIGNPLGEAGLGPGAEETVRGRGAGAGGG